jgi:sulfatase maturation enzyme AslB (radical SAM superfamily)
MTFDVARKFIDKLLNNEYDFINVNNTKGIMLDFIGGEPLMEIELIDQILTYTIN